MFWGYNSRKLIRQVSILSDAAWQHECLWTCSEYSENSFFGWEKHTFSHLWGLDHRQWQYFCWKWQKEKKEPQSHRSRISTSLLLYQAGVDEKYSDVPLIGAAICCWGCFNRDSRGAVSALRKLSWLLLSLQICKKQGCRQTNFKGSEAEFFKITWCHCNGFWENAAVLK